MCVHSYKIRYDSVVGCFLIPFFAGLAAGPMPGHTALQGWSPTTITGAVLSEATL